MRDHHWKHLEKAHLMAMCAFSIVTFYGFMCDHSSNNGPIKKHNTMYFDAAFRADSNHGLGSFVALPQFFGKIFYTRGFSKSNYTKPSRFERAYCHHDPVIDD